MRSYMLTTLVLMSVCGLSVVNAAEQPAGQGTKTAQFYYQPHQYQPHQYQPNQYQPIQTQPVQNQLYYQPFYQNTQVRPVASQVCIPGVGCGTFLPASATQQNIMYGNYGNGMFNHGMVNCHTGQCNANQGYYHNGNTGIVPPPVIPVNPVAPVIPVAPANYGYPTGSQYMQPVYAPAYNSNLQNTPVAPVQNITPVYPYNYVVQGSNGSSTQAATSNNSTSSTTAKSPFFE